MEEVIIKASQDLRSKEELINKWKQKCEHFETQLAEYKKETDERIDELENDMECILQEKKEADSTHRIAIEEARRSIDNLNKDLKHYSDLYQTCENNCNTICKEKLKNVTGKFFRFI